MWRVAPAVLSKRHKGHSIEERPVCAVAGKHPQRQRVGFAYSPTRPQAGRQQQPSPPRRRPSRRTLPPIHVCCGPVPVDGHRCKGFASRSVSAAAGEARADGRRDCDRRCVCGVRPPALRGREGARAAGEAGAGALAVAAHRPARQETQGPGKPLALLSQGAERGGMEACRAPLLQHGRGAGPWVPAAHLMRQRFSGRRVVRFVGDGGSHGPGRAHTPAVLY